MLPTLRDYQIRNKEQLREGYRSFRSQVLVQPCGSGKGTQAADLVDSVNAKRWLRAVSG